MPIPQITAFSEPQEEKTPEIIFDDTAQITEYHDDDFDPDSFFGSDFNFQLWIYIFNITPRKKEEKNDDNVYRCSLSSLSLMAVFYLV